MKKWFTHSDAVGRNHKNPFTSNLLNLWSSRLKNKNENKESKESPYTHPSIAITPTTITTTPLISTRGHFSLVTGKLNSLHDKRDYNYYNASSSLWNSYPHNNEIVIYIHGVWTKQTSAKEQTDRTRLSLYVNGYNIPIIGFSWDSNTAVNPTGWSIAKHIANQNGSKIAKFISDFKNNCPNVNIRIIAHSLGAKVVESALITLNDENNQKKWKKNTSYSIASIHLIGAAIDEKSASKNTPFGNAIENIVDKFYNLYNPEDNALKYAYVKTENQNPLGLYGLKKGEPCPINYSERNVKFEIPPLKRASGIYQTFCDKAVYGWGNNHCGYIGFRERYPFNQILKDDGAINVIVTDWRVDSKIYG
jgi:esterase/lipase superfamily enzyme